MPIKYDSHVNQSDWTAVCAWGLPQLASFLLGRTGMRACARRKDRLP
jgi:hypothetical protein